MNGTHRADPAATDRNRTPDSDPPEPGGIAKVEESRRLQSIWLTVARMTAAVFTMAIPMVLTRVLDQTTFGYYKQLFLIATTVSALLTLGLPGSLYYFVPRSPENGQRYQVQSALMLSVLGLVGGAVIILATPTIQRLFNDAPLAPYLPWIALFTLLSMPAELIPISPMVDRRARLAATLVTGFDLLRAVLLVGAAVITRNLVVIILAATIVVGLKVASVVAYLAWRRRHSPRSRSGGLLLSQLAYAVPFAGTAVIGMFRNQLHAFFVAAKFSAAEFAVYAVATLSIPLIDQITQTVGEVVILENSKNFAAGRREEARRIWHRATYSLALILIPIYAIGVIFAQDIMVVLFGADYASAAPIFRIYMTIVPLSILLASPMLRATADLRLMLAADVASLGVAIASLLLLIGPLGPTGAITSLVLARAAFIALASKRTARRLELSVVDFLPWRGLAIMAMLAFGTGLAAAALTSDLHVVARMFLGGGLALVGYGGIALATSLVPATERKLIADILRRHFGGRGSPKGTGTGGAAQDEADSGSPK